MSELNIYELDDIVWADFERSGDHTVPHPTEGHGSEEKREGDTSKKPRLEVTPFQSNEERDCKALNEENNMMDEDSWSRIHDGVFTASGDTESAKETPTLQSGDTNLSDHCFKSSNITSGSELCTDEGVLKDTSGVVDSNSYNDISLFNNYGWPDIGNFEDMDTMLSNCDSSFGLGVPGNDDELVWFTSEDPSGGYGEAMKMEFKFPNSESSGLTNVSQDHVPRESDSLMLKAQKEQSKQQNQAQGNYSLKSNDNQICSSDDTDKLFTSINNQQNNKILEQDSFGYMPGSSYLHPGHDNVPMEVKGGGSLMTGIKSENMGPTSLSQKETLNTSSHAHSVETSSSSGNRKQISMVLQASSSNLVSSQNQFRMETKFESQNDMEGDSKRGSAELDSVDVPEGSSVSSELDEISLEAKSFRQLKQVMEQLDTRTKLCIRDSLYRLARSAEQRHNYAGGPLMTEGANKYTGLIDMETDTNPIDRTIAHLLFHRPSESSKMPTTLPVKPNAKVHGSTAGPPMVTEKQSCQQTENKSDDKISGSGNN